jgi:hypothetical protein
LLPSEKQSKAQGDFNYLGLYPTASYQIDLNNHERAGSVMRSLPLPPASSLRPVCDGILSRSLWAGWRLGTNLALYQMIGYLYPNFEKRIWLQFVYPNELPTTGERERLIRQNLLF